MKKLNGKGLIGIVGGVILLILGIIGLKSKQGSDDEDTVDSRFYDDDSSFEVADE